MNPVLSAIVVLAAIGAVCALILVIASKYMAVPVDERFPAIRDCLPGANCGACGYAGCDGYAQALVDGTETRTNLCVPGASTAAAGIAAQLGVEAAEVEQKVAYVKCNGSCTATKQKYEYAGIQDCAAAAILFSGEWACPSSCMGCGDCAKVCPNNAIKVVDGVARIASRLCVGCGLCAAQCPKHIIALRKVSDATVVRCSNTEKGAKTRAACEKGCIGCKKCEKACPTGAITVVNNLATIDYEKCVGCKACSEECPVGVIQRV